MNNNIFLSEITWDRIWIFFHIQGLPKNAKVYIKNIKTLEEYPLYHKDYYSKDIIGVSPDISSNNIPATEEGSTFDHENASIFKLNITNPGNCTMLSPGLYKLYTYYNPDKDLNDKMPLSKIIPIDSHISNIKRNNRQFIYFHSERAYRIQFSDKNGFIFRASDIELPEKNIIKKLISKIRTGRNNLAKSILRTIYNIEFIFLHRNGIKKAFKSANKVDNKGNIRENTSNVKDNKNIHNINNPHILLMSDQAEEIGSNMQALMDALTSRGYKIDTAFRAITTKHYNILHWIKTLAKIAKADYIFLDDHSQTTDWLTIKDTIITQIWHAGAGFKSTGYSRFGMPASPAPKSGHRQYTYGIAGSLKIRHFFSEVWGINDEMVLPTGMPRLDQFLDKAYIEKTKEELYKDYPELCKPNGKNKIILFAPTYRGQNKKNAYYPFNKLDMDKLYTLCAEQDLIFLIKMHPFVEYKTPIPQKYKDRILDLTKYPNINDLYYVTDLLITDYSSGIYEFSLMNKPMLFYAFDIDEYTKERGFHRDYRENVPGKIVETFSDMLRAIENHDYEYEKVKIYQANNFDHVDSHACDRIIDFIICGKNVF
ncbi:MAG: CDP-glycerol glycerophosphotransferase family protein [Eubacterium sp.]|nr:CDP-glycerol glycerophosphotransferase family protein [Eubacterium sp.]